MLQELGFPTAKLLISTGNELVSSNMYHNCEIIFYSQSSVRFLHTLEASLQLSFIRNKQKIPQIFLNLQEVGGFF